MTEDKPRSAFIEWRDDDVIRVMTVANDRIDLYVGDIIKLVEHDLVSEGKVPGWVPAYDEPHGRNPREFQVDQ